MRIWTAIFSCVLMLFTLKAMAWPQGDSAGHFPDEVLAVQSDDGFAKAMKEAQAALKKHDLENRAGVDQKQVLILGWITKGQQVTIEVGAINNIWPTSVLKTGEIQAMFRPFPDGVNGVEVSQVKYVDAAKATRYPDSGN